MKINIIFLMIAIFGLLTPTILAKAGKKKKSLMDMTDAEIEAIYDEWEENDEDELEDDEKPAWKKQQTAPEIDLSKLDTSDPEAMLAASKKGKSLMMFVAVSGTFFLGITRFHF